MNPRYNNAYTNFILMIRDSRVQYVKHLIETHQLTLLEDILEHYPRTPFGKHFGKNSTRMTEFIQKANLLDVEKIDEMGEIFSVDPVEIFKLAHRQYKTKIQPGKKKKRK